VTFAEGAVYEGRFKVYPVLCALYYVPLECATGVCY
jgi:hypothetical protein